MKEEKKEKTEEKECAIIVLDEGIQAEDGTEWVCCTYTFSPLRW